MTRSRILNRLLIGLPLLVVAFLLDHQAYSVLRTLTLYDHVGEIREGLTAAKFLGSGIGTLLVTVLVGSLDPRGWRRAGALALAVLLANGAATLVKVASGRERPSHEDQVPGRERFAFRGPAMGLRHAPFQSFPSGHTTSSFATATCLASFYPPARVVVYAVACATAVNRVVKHQHFLSDVVAAALLGHLMTLWVLGRRRVRRWWQGGGDDNTA